jgi:hypothetical protein
VAPQQRGQLFELRHLVEWRLPGAETSVKIGAEADVLRAARGPRVMDDVVDHVVQTRAA